MSSEAAPAVSGGWLTRLLALGSTALSVAIYIVPKDATTAADSRMVMTAIFLASTMVSGASVMRLIAQWRHQRLLRRFGPAGSTVRDTLSYLHTERQLAKRGYLSASAACGVAFGAHLLSYWPQLSPLAPLRDLLGSAALLCAAAGPLLYFNNRRHRSNCRYLRQCLRQPGQ